MGRQTHEENHDGISMEKSSAHRKWVKILNVLDYHRWNYVKKMLPHRRHGEGRDGYEAIYVDDEKVNVGAKGHVCNGDVCTFTVQSPQTEEKVTKDAVIKGRATRIREKISKEVLKKRLRHRRSSTGLATSCLIENVPRLNAQVINEQDLSNDEALDSNRSLFVIHANFEDFDEKSGTPCTTKSVDIMDNYYDKGSSDVESTFPMTIQNIERLGRSATFDQSKEVMDAMEVLSMNKGFFLKVLVNPKASLAQNFMVRHTSDKWKSLDKSRTFPRSCPSQESELTIKTNGKGNIDEIGRKSFSHIPKVEVGGKSFKDLREKIKHVIKEETHRIAMDSVLHKVVYGQQYPETKKDVVEQLSLKMDVFVQKDNKHHDHSVNRCPPLNESMERYCQSIENSLANKPNNISSISSMKLRVKDSNESQPWGTLGRISSSPDLFMCLRSPIEESDDESSSLLTKGISLPRRPMRVSQSFNELDTHIMLSCFGVDGKTMEPEKCSSSSVVDNNVTKSPTRRFEKPSPEFVEDSGISKKPISSEEESIKCITNSEHAEADSEAKLPRHVRVEGKDQEQFDYVKEVLQLSGYLENQALGAWQSQDQPMDTSLFAELEGCSFQEPDLSEPEETTRCNRLLLFDSINEVLLSTYERSMAYWSSPLTNCSYIHPMPKGYRVLEMVWSHMSWHLNSAANHLESSLDQVIMHDLGEDDGWMNLQFDAEGTALELESLIFEEFIMEVIMPIL